MLSGGGGVVRKRIITELWDLLNSDNTSLLNVLLEQKRRKRDIYLKPILYLMVKKVVILMTLLKQPIIFTYLM